MENRAEHLGQRIKILREHSGFTQSNIAKYLQVDQSLISMAEKGRRALTSDMLDKLAVLFGVQLSAFEEDADVWPLSFALRASEIDETDMETISSINRIALNCDFMTRLLEGGASNG